MTPTDAEIIATLNAENAQLRREVATLTAILALTDARLARLAANASSVLQFIRGAK